MFEATPELAVQEKGAGWWNKDGKQDREAWGRRKKGYVLKACPNWWLHYKY